MDHAHSDGLSQLFSFIQNSEFMPHGHCYLWLPELVWLHVISDFIIASAYYSIPILLIFFIKKRKDIPYPWVFLLFALFILLCGTTHLLEIWNLWNSNYWLSGEVKLATAIVSILTAASLIPILPKLLSLRSPAELEKINIDLNLANQAALQAAKSKSTFLASMSHEIRTPMNGILGLCNLTLGTELNKEQRENLELIKSSADSLMKIINDILDLSKLESATNHIETGAFDIYSLLQDTIDFFKFQFKQKNMTLLLDIAPLTPHFVESDSDRIRQILVNLIGNALKFADTGTTHVKVNYSAPNFIFEVSDEGIGVPSNKEHLLFNPFSQVDQTSQRRFQGTGLGLSICQKIVILMDGSIEYKANSPKGSRFIFSLPLKISNKEFFEKQKINAQEFKYSLNHKNLRVLIADDNSVNLAIIRKMLEDKVQAVDTCANGLEVIAQLEKFSYDVILMDCEMPLFDGYQTTEKIRSSTHLNKNNQTIPIIAITADAMSAAKVKALASGMNDYLTKPLHLKDLIAALNKWCPEVS